jgi:hypothetical protein
MQDYHTPIRRERLRQMQMQEPAWAEAFCGVAVMGVLIFCACLLASL